MPIKFRCPHCQQFLGISRSKAGAVTDCPTCGRTIRVPLEDGTVKPLPPPRLNLDDEKLLAALGALADVGSVSGTEPDNSPALVSPEVIEPPAESLSPEAVPVEHVQPQLIAQPIDPEGQLPVVESLEGNPLDELTQVLPEQTVAKDTANPGRLRTGWLALAIMMALGGGVVIGLLIRRNGERDFQSGAPQVAEHQRGAEEVPVPVEHENQRARIVGTVTFEVASGAAEPDRGARVLLLPLERVGAGKLPYQGFRVGADESDRQLLAASATILGGGFEFADSQGKFTVSPSATGRFGLLVASRYQSRPASGAIPERCQKFLKEYFDRPEMVIGNVAYRFSEVELDEGMSKQADFAFTID